MNSPEDARVSFVSKGAPERSTSIPAGTMTIIRSLKRIHRSGRRLAARIGWPLFLMALSLLPCGPGAVAQESGSLDRSPNLPAVEKVDSFSESLLGTPFRKRDDRVIPILQQANTQQANTEEQDPTQAKGSESSVVPASHQETVVDALTAEIVATRRTAAEQTPDITDEVKAQISKQFQRALDSISQKTEFQKRTAEFKAEKENGPTLIADLRTKLAEPFPSTDPAYPENATIPELDALRIADEERANEARRNLEAWELKAKLRAERKPQMPTLIESTHQLLGKAEEALAGPAPEGEMPLMTVARKTEQEATVDLLRAELELYRVEQTRYESLIELFPLQRDLLARSKNAAEKRAEAWNPVLSEARRQESVRQERQARESLRNAHPTLRDLAEDNSMLTKRRSELQAFIGSSVKDLSEVNATLTSLEKKFKINTEKERRVGLTTAIGQILRNQRDHLPNGATYRLQQQTVEHDIVRLQTEQMEYEDKRNDLGDIQAKVDETIGETAQSGEVSAELRQMTLELLTDRTTYLDNLLADYEACLQTLNETDVACGRLDKTITEYSRYIDERVFWIRSANAVDSAFIPDTLKAAKSLLTHPEWSPLMGFIYLNMETYWGIYVAGLITFVLNLVLGRKWRGMISALGAVSKKQLDSGTELTLKATGLTIAIAAAWPFLLWFMAWRIGQSNLNLASAYSNAFLYCAVSLWLVNSFRVMCRKNGVAEAFLEWPQPVVRSLHANLLLYIIGGIPLSIIVIVTGILDEGTTADSLGRFAFVCLCLLLAAILRRIVRPTGPLIGDLLRSSPQSVMYRLRWLWYPLAIGSPVCLAILALMGYQYTAEQLMVRIQWTLCLSIVLQISYTMVMQWMLGAKRNLALKQARARRAAAVAAAQRESEEGGVTSSPIPPVETPLVNLSLLNQQMLQLVRGTGFIVFLTLAWGIWGQVLPALQVFSRIELWQVVVESAQMMETPDAGPSMREFTRVESITLGSVLFAAFVLSAAILASRNLPGLLELVVLQRLPMDHGGRNAITTLCRYVFILAGTVIACNSIGISWGSVQWLAAALTVGLGFGLQEIFANFISGLIILFERPVRIGDIITMDGISGCVSRIQIRATTITDWDRKEYIVPNKEFVTGKVLNWTLSDKVNRVVVNVGVAYGTNTDTALRMMQTIAEEHPLVMSEPPPVVSFEGFGDSCLNLILRCYLPNLDHRLKVISDLHTTINQRFSAQGIEIPYPQRDLHIRSLAENLSAAAALETRLSQDSVTMPSSSKGDSKRAS